MLYFKSNDSYIIIPKDNTSTSFIDYAKLKEVPVVICSDFESSLIKHNDPKKTYITHKLSANSYRIKIVSIVDLVIPLDYVYYGSYKL